LIGFSQFPAQVENGGCHCRRAEPREVNQELKDHEHCKFSASVLSGCLWAFCGQNALDRTAEKCLKDRKDEQNRTLQQVEVWNFGKDIEKSDLKPRELQLTALF
jgi:hypothetical protein